MMILGITGLAGSGKSTLASLLTHCGWSQTRFASPIKSMIMDLLRYQGVERAYAIRMVDGDLKEQPSIYLCGQTPRRAMQTLGTEWRNLIDRNLWVEVWKNKLIEFPPSSKIIVDDLRFIHEAMAVRSMGGKIIRIVRPNATTTPSSTHASETEMVSIVVDQTIINDGSIPELLTKFHPFLSSWS